ncbi:MAG: metallophosphoesterase [Halioglobus sp.]
MNTLYSINQSNHTRMIRSIQACLVGLLLTLLIHPEISHAQGLRIAVISDINGRYGSSEYNPRLARAIAQIIELKPNLVISTGDMVAGQRPAPKLTRTELEEMWNSFHKEVRVPLETAGIPLLMTPGNHDASGYAGYELERDIYREYHLNHPQTIQPLPGGSYPYYFATEHEGTLLVSLDATRSGTLDFAQRTWLSETLPAQGGKPILVFGHLPLQAVAIGREQDIVSDTELERLLVTHSVTAYLSGHHHAWYPGERLDIAMISIGNLGGNQRSLVGTTIKTGFSFALLELDEAGIKHITAYTGPDFQQPIDDQALPPQLGRDLKRINPQSRP